MNKIKQIIKRWYLGGPLPINEKIQNGYIHRLPGTYRPSISAKLAKFVIKNIWKTLAFIIPVAVTLFIYFDHKADSKPEYIPKQEILNTHKSPTPNKVTK